MSGCIRTLGNATYISIIYVCKCSRSVYLKPIGINRLCLLSRVIELEFPGPRKGMENENVWNL